MRQEFHYYRFRIYMAANKAFGHLASLCIKASKHCWKRQQACQFKMLADKYSKKPGA